MVDTETSVKDTTLSEVTGRVQGKWYMHLNTNSYGMHTGMHLRHNGRANVWMPDGHTEDWNANDTTEFNVPGSGTLGNTPLGYVY